MQDGGIGVALAATALGTGAILGGDIYNQEKKAREQYKKLREYTGDTITYKEIKRRGINFNPKSPDYRFGYYVDPTTQFYQPQVNTDSTQSQVNTDSTQSQDNTDLLSI